MVNKFRFHFAKTGETTRQNFCCEGEEIYKQNKYNEASMVEGLVIDVIYLVGFSCTERGQI